MFSNKTVSCRTSGFSGVTKFIWLSVFPSRNTSVLTLLVCGMLLNSLDGFRKFSFCTMAKTRSRIASRRQKFYRVWHPGLFRRLRSRLVSGISSGVDRDRIVGRTRARPFPRKNHGRKLASIPGLKLRVLSAGQPGASQHQDRRHSFPSYSNAASREPDDHQPTPMLDVHHGGEVGSAIRPIYLDTPCWKGHWHPIDPRNIYTQVTSWPPTGN